MPFPADFWIDGWERVIHPHDFPNPTTSTVASDTNWVWNNTSTSPASTCNLIQGPLNQTGDPTKAPSENVGYLLGKSTADPTIQLRVNIIYPVGTGMLVDPAVSSVKLPSYGIVERQYPRYKPPFYRIFGPSIDWWVRGNGPSGGLVYDLFHVQPIAFTGTVSEVIGAILMYAGVDPTFIDQDSFDWAYDEEIAVGPDNANRPIVWVIPMQGESYIQTIKRVTMHWSHMFCWSLNGKISLVPCNSADSPISILDTKGNIKKMESDIDLDRLTNKCHAMHGAFSKHWSEGGWVSPEPYQNAQWEPKLKSDYLGEFTDLYEDSDSQDRYGIRVLGDRPRGTGESTTLRQAVSYSPTYGFGFRNIDIVTEGQDIKILPLPLYYLKTIKNLFMAMFTSNEARPRLVGRITQDLLGLDMDIGTMVEVFPPPPGDPVRYRVFKQSVDWNSLTVVSDVIETFGTEFPTASTVIWTYINPEIQPVGTAVLTKLGLDRTLTITLPTTPGLDWWWEIYISKDGGEFVPIELGWTAVTGDLSVVENWTGTTRTVDVLIRGADDDGSGGLSIATPFTTMPQAT